MESCVCAICKEPLSNGQAVVQLRQKGSDGINVASVKRGVSVHTTPGQSVHVECRKSFCNNIVIALDKRKRGKSEESNSRNLRSTQTRFFFDKHCLFCGQLADIEQKSKSSQTCSVRTIDFQTTIENIAKERRDRWADEVNCRLQSVLDLAAAGAVYHKSCSSNFRTGKQPPVSVVTVPNEKRMRKPTGRPQNVRQLEAFLEIAQYLAENDDEQITLADLVGKMKDICAEDAYSIVYMKKKLKEHFGPDLVFTEINGKPNVVTFRHTVSSILQDFHQRPQKQGTDAEKLDIVRTAAKLILSDIKAVESSKDTYPLPCELSSVSHNAEFIPATLKLFLKTVFIEKEKDVKVATIGQAIMQAARPRVLIAPLQLGLGVQMHHHFASKFLVDTLYSFGFCSSYHEVQRFESCAAVAQEANVSEIPAGHFMQFVADNVDHNISTLDGQNTFHGMGMIAGITPSTKVDRYIPRINVSTDDLVVIGKIDIHFFKCQDNAKESLPFTTLPENKVEDHTWKLDLMSKVAWPLTNPPPSWAGLMQMAVKGEHPGQSSVSFLPMIDMNPSDMSCIYSTLKYVCSQASRYEAHPVLTFDQPLYWKALTIIRNESAASELRSLVLRLGGFHIEMCFIGCIGHLMSGSGLREVLETVYAPNAVGHMPTGKAVARAVRGHLLVDKALNTLLMANVYGADTFAIPSGMDNGSCDSEHLHDLEPHDGSDDSTAIELMSSCSHYASEDSDLQKLAETNECDVSDRRFSDIVLIAKSLEKLQKDEMSVEAVCALEALDRIHSEMEMEKRTLSQSRTAKLWLQYMQMVDILRRFIKAERTGNWQLHLQVTKEMLPYFAAAGRNLYLKSAYVYLQQMHKLCIEHPQVSTCFDAGYHVLRRSDRFWAGLSTDLVIEQVLMRSVKATGGLTRGRGMTESERSQWLFSMPSCAEVNSALQQLTNVGYTSSDQHKDLSNTRMTRDRKDAQTFLEILRERNPFGPENCLRNIESGVAAADNVNVDNAKAIGDEIVKDMLGKGSFDYSFKRSQQAVTLSAKTTSLKADEDQVEIDPQLLFQRLTIAAKGLDEDITLFLA